MMLSVKAHDQVACEPNVLCLAIILFLKLNLDVIKQDIHSAVYHRSYCLLLMSTTSLLFSLPGQ